MQCCIKKADVPKVIQININASREKCQYLVRSLLHLDFDRRFCKMIGGKLLREPSVKNITKVLPLF